MESVACHERDPFPRVLLLIPTATALVFGFVFALSPNLTAAPGVKPAFSAAGFAIAALCIGYALAGLPAFRRDGCARGCAALARAPASLLCAAAAPRQHRDSAPEFELPRGAVAAAAAAANPFASERLVGVAADLEHVAVRAPS